MLSFRHMQNETIEKVISIFTKYPKIKLAYFFGSRAEKREGPKSDYDFAVYLNEKDRKKMFDIKSLLMDDLSRALETDKIDVVVLNTAESPEIKYRIIKDGKLIYEKEPYRILVEPRILQTYFDFHQMLVRHGLTKAQ
ncbi:MAG: nucleotidyltransferase domain-containing protein [Parcubacteria group bacterium]